MQERSPLRSQKQDCRARRSLTMKPTIRNARSCVSDEAIRAAGYRAVRLCEWSDWGHPIYTGPLIYRTVSLCIIDPSAIVSREIV